MRVAPANKARTLAEFAIIIEPESVPAGPAEQRVIDECAEPLAEITAAVEAALERYSAVETAWLEAGRHVERIRHDARAPGPVAVLPSALRGALAAQEEAQKARVVAGGALSRARSRDADLRRQYEWARTLARKEDAQ